MSCSDSGPEYADLPRVAEALRLADEALTDSCDEGFPGFLTASTRVLEGVPGAERFHESMVSFRQPGAAMALGAVETELFRLVLRRYAVVCRAPAARARLEQLESTEARAAGLRELLEEAPLPGAERRLGSEDEGVHAMIVELPATVEPERAPVMLFACLECRAGSPVEGPRQIEAALATLEALAAAPLRRAHPIELVICLDASRKPANCARHIDGERPVTAALALDGTEPLVVSWSAEVSWHLALSHAATSERWLALQQRRAAVRPDPDAAPLVVAAEAAGTLESLPAEAWMELVAPGRSAAELREQVEGHLLPLTLDRPEASYQVEVREERLRVTARGPTLPAWEIDERQNALWDLAAAARELQVDDPPRGGLAAMLQVVSRFDGDPYGARLGLHYDDPIGGPLLVTPCTMVARDGRVILGLRMYRPPGLDHSAFLDRLADARGRLRYAAGRSVVVAERQVGDPSSISPSSELVRLVQRAFVELTDEAEIPEPTGSPRPGLGMLRPDTLSLRLPTTANRVNPEPPTMFLVDLLWRLALTPESGDGS